MRVTTLVLSSALLAGGFVALDKAPIEPSASLSQASMVDRSSKADRLAGSYSNDIATEASVHIKVDADKGMTTVIRKAAPVTASGETDFAFLAQ